MHYWTCVTQYKVIALSGPSKHSQAKSKWMEADRHIFAVMSVCGFQKASAVALTCTYFIHLCTCLLISPFCRNVLAPLMGRDTGDGYIQQFCVCKMGISSAHPSSRRKGCQDQEGAQVLISSCLWVQSLLDPYKLRQLNILWWEIPIFKALQIFTALGPLREKQIIFTFLLTLPFSGLQLDDKDHGDLRCFQRAGRVDTKNAGRLLIACIHLQGRLTLKNVTLIAQGWVQRMMFKRDKAESSAVPTARAAFRRRFQHLQKVPREL